MGRYGKGMIETTVHSKNPVSVETTMRDELSRSDDSAQSVVPILRHLLASDDNSLFSDEIVARVRGMVGALALQLLEAMAAVESEGECVAKIEEFDHEDASIAALTSTFIGNTAFLRHIHALAVEWQFTERLQSRLALDPVVSPLLQANIASASAELSALAMKLLASQARFCQTQRRMHLPLLELPGDMLNVVLDGLTAVSAGDASSEKCAVAAREAIRASHDDATTRLGLIARLLSGMGGGATEALSVTQAGPAIFLSALAMGSGQDRAAAVLSTNEVQMARLALALRAAGLKPSVVEEQFFALHPDIALPEGFERLGADRAAAILAVGDGYPGG